MKFLNVKNPLLETTDSSKYNPLIDKLSSSKKQKKVLQWYNKVTSETYSKVDSMNSTLLKKNADPKKLAFTNSDTSSPIPFKNDFDSPETRTFFHTKSKISWLSRYKKTVKPDYLYLPEEKLKRIELTRIFRNFDEDNNNMLELDEFLEMILQNY